MASTTIEPSQENTVSQEDVNRLGYQRYMEEFLRWRSTRPDPSYQEIYNYILDGRNLYHHDYIYDEPPQHQRPQPPPPQEEQEEQRETVPSVYKLKPIQPKKSFPAENKTKSRKTIIGTRMAGGRESWKH